MSNEIAVRGGASALAITDGQDYWTERQLATLAQLGVADAGEGDLAVFFHQSVRTGLDPFAKQIYMIGRKESVKDDNDNWVKVQKWTIQTGIDGYRLVARRAADRAGQQLTYEDTLWCGPDGNWRDVWLEPQPPLAAKVVVYRGAERFSAVAHWPEYVQTKYNGEPNSMWSRMGRNQLAKCAEALALRKAFPQDLSGIYTDDEMGQADARAEREAPQPQAPQRTASERLGSAINRSVEKAADDAGVAVDVATGEVLEGEVVTEPAPPAITKAQLTALNAGLTALGYRERPAIYAVLTRELGREITSSAQLTKAEASKLIDRIQAGEVAGPEPVAEQLPDTFVEEPPADWKPVDGDDTAAGAA